MWLHMTHCTFWDDCEKWIQMSYNNSNIDCLCAVTVSFFCAIFHFLNAYCFKWPRAEVNACSIQYIRFTIQLDSSETKNHFFLSAWFDRFVVFHALMKYDNQNQIVGVFSPTIVDLTSHWMASFSVYKKISFVWSFDSFWFTAKFYECQSYVCFYTVMFLNNVFCCCNIQLWSYLFRWQIKLFF